MSSTVTVIIVNYRTARLVAKCLDSLARERSTMPRLRAVVVDNASADGSVEWLCSLVEGTGWRDWVSVVASTVNGGFAYGNNTGIRASLHPGADVDFLMLLNPDTIVRPNALGALVDFMRTHPQTGIAGSLLEDARGASVTSAHNAPSPLGELEGSARLGLLTRMLGRYAVSLPVRPDAHACEWVSGAALMMRRVVAEQLGPMDEGYFLYFEEVDYCVRARRAGWQVWFVPDSRVVHLEGASTGIGELARRRPPYWFDSRRRYFVKHHGIGGLLAADLLWAAGHASLGLRRALGLGKGGGPADPQHFLQDLLSGDLRALFSKELWKLRTC